MLIYTVKHTLSHVHLHLIHIYYTLPIQLLTLYLTLHAVLYRRYIFDTCVTGTEYYVAFTPNNFCAYDSAANDYYLTSCTGESHNYDHLYYNR